MYRHRKAIKSPRADYPGELSRQEGSRRVVSRAAARTPSRCAGPGESMEPDATSMDARIVRGFVRTASTPGRRDADAAARVSIRAARSAESAGAGARLTGPGAAMPAGPRGRHRAGRCATGAAEARRGWATARADVALPNNQAMNQGMTTCAHAGHPVGPDVGRGASAYAVSFARAAARPAGARGPQLLHANSCPP